MTQEEQSTIFNALYNLSFCIGYMELKQPNKCQEMKINLDKATETMFAVMRRT